MEFFRQLNVLVHLICLANRRRQWFSGKAFGKEIGRFRAYYRFCPFIGMRVALERKHLDEEGDILPGFDYLLHLVL